MLSKQRGSTATVGSKNIIELNGKHYDSLTGRLVVKDSAQPASPSASRPVKLTTGVSMDGVSRSKHGVDTKEQTANHLHIAPAEHSKTLMRAAVKKPQPIIKDGPVKHTKQTEVPPPLNPKITDNSKIDADRQARSTQIAKSKLVSKFSDAEPRSLGKPVVKPLNIASDPSIQTEVSQRDSFQDAIDQAVSHQQPQFKKQRVHHRVAKKLHVSPRVLSVAMASLAMVLIGGFVAYQNIPNVAIRVASTRSGVRASLPAYQPAGFAFTGPIHYKPGQVTVSFKSNSDNERKYSITQSVSSWNSETLLENFITTKNQPFQTYQAGGKTIYIYNGTNATWVDGGVWYKVEGNSSLSNEQLLRLASSI